MIIEDIKLTTKQENKLAALKQIIELTQQNQSKQQTRNLTGDDSDNIQSKSCLDCLFNILKDIRNCFRIKGQILQEFITNEAEFSATIENIKKQKIKPVIPAQRQIMKTLVLDLDETLIHTTFEKNQHYDFQIQMNSGNKKVTGYIIKRFGLDSFLFQMSKRYEIIVFTAARKRYADLVIDKIDPKKRIKYRLYRNNTISLNKTFYLKSLQALGRDLQTTLLVDDNSLAGILQPQNFYRIEPFTGNAKDRKLVQLAGFLKYLSKKNDVRSVLAHRKKYEEGQILLSQQKQNILTTSNNEKLSLSQKQEEGITQVSSVLSEKQNNKEVVRKEKARKYTHKKVNSEVEELITTQGENSAITLKIR